ncbi:NEW3 domain-containing protein [Streptomyces solicathayae]|uniref:NEW3 domain-containing protein n=1 Tax=Streptomyces solicathayae TaxID=3081768 RepID=A0ABZ0LMT6_9ACTN|nr:NEW3 domain-containing protein [Streptomyces sp. HUAS YS2]WOX20784.1 NEW3 domain-containing protein [Streptomyces sp. HUAS YS2]
MLVHKIARRAVAAVAVAAAAFVSAPAAVAAQAPAASEARTQVTIAPIDLDGPAISEVKVTVTNAGPERLSRLSVTFNGPVGWAVQPAVVDVDGAYKPGAAATAEFRIQVPEQRDGFTMRTFTATATYKGGDGQGTATGTRVERFGPVLDRLSDAYNKVAITDESDTGAGDFDGEGNSFSAQKLAAVGLTPGASVDALGARLTWPAAAPGTKNSVASSGQAVKVSGKGGKLVFLGSGVGYGATGTATVFYTDGTSTTGSIGFPNWSFQDATAHGATLVKSTDGRNRPDGYGNAGIDYRVFAHSVALDPDKQVELVVLPANAALHLFDVALAP